jgi:hypothetical protein
MNRIHNVVEEVEKEKQQDEYGDNNEREVFSELCLKPFENRLQPIYKFPVSLL